MTILHVTDFHFNQRWYDWLLHRAPVHDLLVMTGDMLDLANPMPHRKQIQWVSSWMNEYPGSLCVCSGNHDLEWNPETSRWTPAYWLRDLANPNVWVDGQRARFHDLEIFNIACTTRPKGGVADIWVVHAPPTNTLVSTRVSGGDGGDPDLADPVRRYSPRLVLTGHVHDPVRWSDERDQTVYLNPGSTPDAPFPNHILIQTGSLTCQYVTAGQARPLLREIPSFGSQIASQHEAVAAGV